MNVIQKSEEENIQAAAKQLDNRLIEIKTI